jgi:hypothetical protein
MGALSGFALSVGLPGVLLAVGFIVVIGTLLPHWSGLAGGLAGLGILWLILFTNAAIMCAQPGDRCGATPPDVMPWILFSLALIGASGLAIAATLRRRSALQKPRS